MMSTVTSDAAIHTQDCSEAGILTSLDGGGLRYQNPRILRIHRRLHRRRAAMRADGPDAGGSCGFLKSRGAGGGITQGRTTACLVRTRRVAIRALPASPSRANGYSIPRRGRCVPRRLGLSYLPIPAKLADHVGFCARRIAYKIQAPWNEAGMPTLDGHRACGGEFSSACRGTNRIATLIKFPFAWPARHGPSTSFSSADAKTWMPGKGRECRHLQ